MHFSKAIGVYVSVVFVAAAISGCQSKQTTGKKRSFDPLLDKFASNFEVGEEGYMVSDERSEYEARGVQRLGELGTKRYEAPSRKGRGFSGSNRYEAGTFDGAREQAFDGVTPVFGTSESGLGRQQAGAAGMAPVERGVYDTGVDRESAARYGTGADREVSGRRETYPDPLIIDSGQEPMTVSEVKQLLERN